LYVIHTSSHEIAETSAKVAWLQKYVKRLGDINRKLLKQVEKDKKQLSKAAQTDLLQKRLLFKYKTTNAEGNAVGNRREAAGKAVLSAGAKQSPTLPDSLTAQSHLAWRLRECVGEAKRLVKARKRDHHSAEEQATWQLQAATASSKAFRHEMAVVAAAGPVRGLIKAASQNLWNLERDWPTRRLQIAKLLRKLQPDVIALQEVRRWGNGTTQADQLASLLRGYSVVYKAINPLPAPPDPNATATDDEAEDQEEDPAPVDPAAEKRKKEAIRMRILHNPKGTHEGMAVLSRLPVLSQGSRPVSILGDFSNDDNHRANLRVTVKSRAGPLHVVASHFSYDDVQQCLNVAALHHFVSSLDPKEPTLLMGDFNTYFGFEWPMDLLAHPPSSMDRIDLNPCTAPWKVQQGSAEGGDLVAPAVDLPRNSGRLFTDAWRSLHPAPPELHGERDPIGDTFSAAEDFGSEYNDNPPSRPDRIYIGGGGIVPLAATPFGEEDLSEEDAPLVDGKGARLRASDHKGVFVAFVEDARSRDRLRAKVGKIRKNKAVFDAKDKDHDGMLTREELGTVLKAPRVDAFFKGSFDKDKDGKAAWPELMHFLKLAR